MQHIQLVCVTVVPALKLWCDAELRVSAFLSHPYATDACMHMQLDVQSCCVSWEAS